MLHPLSETLSADSGIRCVYRQVFPWLSMGGRSVALHFSTFKALGNKGIPSSIFKQRLLPSSVACSQQDTSFLQTCFVHIWKLGAGARFLRDNTVNMHPALWLTFTTDNLNLRIQSLVWQHLDIILSIVTCFVWDWVRLLWFFSHSYRPTRFADCNEYASVDWEVLWK